MFITIHKERESYQCSNILFDGSILVREAEIILLTFSRGKSILLLNCSLDVQ